MRQFHLPPCGVVSCGDGAAFPGARRSVSPAKCMGNNVDQLFSRVMLPVLGARI